MVIQVNNLKNANFVQGEIKSGVSALEQARGLWRRGRILETVADAADRAARANQPLGQAIQRQANRLLSNKRFRRTLSPDETRWLRQVARADVDTVLSIVGQFRTALGSLPTGAGIGGASLLAGGLDTEPKERRCGETIPECWPNTFSRMKAARWRRKRSTEHGPDRPRKNPPTRC